MIFGMDYLDEGISVMVFILISSALLTLLVLSIRTVERRSKREVEREKDKRIREKDFFLDVIQHDLGNIHQSLMGSLQLARLLKGEKKERTLDSAVTSVLRAHQLIDNTKTLDRLEDKIPDKETVDLIATVRGAISKVSDRFPTKDFSVDLGPHQERIPVVGNKYLGKVFTNILDNAIKFDRNDRSIIRVTFDTRDEFVITSIWDRGPGISDDQIRRIFSRYHERLTERELGSGLSMCTSVLESIGGEITARDRPDGKSGSVFDIKLRKASSE